MTLIAGTDGKAAQQPQGAGQAERVRDEYTMLRAELAEADKSIMQILLLVMGAVSALLAWVYSHDAIGLTLQLILIALGTTVVQFGAEMIAGHRKRIWRIATYLRVFLEGPPGAPRWETNLDRAFAAYRTLRDENSQGSDGGKSDAPQRSECRDDGRIDPDMLIGELGNLAAVNERNMLAFAHLFCGAAFAVMALLGLGRVGGYDPTTKVVIAIYIVVLASCVIKTMRTAALLTRGGPIHQGYLALWEQVRALPD